MQIGDWLSTNGEAIYETEYWSTFGEGPTEVESGHHTEKQNKEFTGQDIRFTQKGDKLYAIMMAWPQAGEVTIKSLGTESEHAAGMDIKGVSLLGGDDVLDFEQTTEGLVVRGLGSQTGDFAHVLAIQR